MESIWIALERAVVAASLGEQTPSQVFTRMCTTLVDDLGAVLQRDARAELSSTTFTTTALDGSALRVVVPAEQGLRTDDCERLRKLFELVVQLAHPFPRGAHTLHKLRNRLGGVMANLEAIDMTLSDVPPGMLTLQSPQHEDILKAIEHAGASCRALSELLVSLQADEAV